MTRQPDPVTTADSQDVLPLVLIDLVDRSAQGIKTYGVPLRSHNGRNALVDAYHECLDMACYLKQAIMEQESPRMDAELAAVRLAKAVDARDRRWAEDPTPTMGEEMMHNDAVDEALETWREYTA